MPFQPYNAVACPTTGKLCEAMSWAADHPEVPNSAINNLAARCAAALATGGIAPEAAENCPMQNPTVPSAGGAI